MMNWEIEFAKHVEETRRIEREIEIQIEKKIKKEKSWELLRECTNFIRENEKNWILGCETKKEKTKVENRKRKLELARIQKEETLMKLRQKKIEESWKMLPETERRNLLKEEEKRRK